MREPNTEFRKRLMNPGQWFVQTGETEPEMDASQPIHRAISRSSNRPCGA